MPSMNTLTLFLSGLHAEYRFFQIDLGSVLTTLREEVSVSICQTPPLKKRYAEITYELLEMAVRSWAHPLGMVFDGHYTLGRLARYYILREDRDEIIQNAVSKLHAYTSNLITKNDLEYPFGYQILSNGNLLIGIDVRDLEPAPEDDEPFGD